MWPECPRVSRSRGPDLQTGSRMGLPVPGERWSCTIKLFRLPTVEAAGAVSLAPLVAWAQPFHTELQLPLCTGCSLRSL